MTKYDDHALFDARGIKSKMYFEFSFIIRIIIPGSNPLALNKIENVKMVAIYFSKLINI